MSLREDREEEFKNEAIREALEFKRVCSECGRRGGQHEMNCPYNEDEEDGGPYYDDEDE